MGVDFSKSHRAMDARQHLETYSAFNKLLVSVCIMVIVTLDVVENTISRRPSPSTSATAASRRSTRRFAYSLVRPYYCVSKELIHNAIGVRDKRRRTGGHMNDLKWIAIVAAPTPARLSNSRRRGCAITG